jgi:hypothetical protein
MNTQHIISIIVIIILLFFVIKPKIVLTLYNNIYGKILLIVLLLLFSFHTIFFGLTLLIIILLVIHWEDKKSLTTLENFKNHVKSEKMINYESNINVNKRIDELTPLNSKQFNVVKTSSNNAEPFSSSSLLKNSRSLII